MAQGEGVLDRSLQSIEQLARIERDVDQQRILVDQHIIENSSFATSGLDESIKALGADLEQAKAAYAPLVELPNEASSWGRAQELLEPFENAIADILALSRESRDDLARNRFDSAMSNYLALHRQLVELIDVNRLGAMEKVHQIATIEREAERLVWLTRLGVFAGILGVAGWGGRIISASERQRAETRSLQERNRDLDAFAGRVAHDLRNTLGPLLLVGPMIRRGRSDPALLSMAGTIERSSRRANATLDALSEFSRSSRGAHAEEAGRLRSAITGVGEELAQRAAELEVLLDIQNIPDVFVRCDEDLLYIVFANVIGNAIKFLAGQPVRRVGVSAHVEGTSCCTEVKDTGPGVPKWAQARIFEPFFRIPGAQAPGEGLGLATVSRIVAARGGRVTVESGSGSGSRFEIWLPLAISPEKRPVLEGQKGGFT